jgi:hypothetical protein
LKNVAATVACLAISFMPQGCIPEEEVLSDNQITAFSFVTPPAEGIINSQAKTIAVAVPAGTDVTALTPVITVSNGATVTPASGNVNNFTNPVQYTVTAANNSTAVYTVTVTAGGATQPEGTPQELITPISANTTLVDRGLAVDYIFRSRDNSLNGSSDWLQITNNATLTIEPGVTIQFTRAGGELHVESGSTVKAVGTAEKRIQLIGGASKGSWDGIAIYSNTDNDFQYVDFINAGSGSSEFDGVVWMNSNTNLRMSYCTIDGSKSYGFYAGNGAVIPVFHHNTIRNCDRAPAYLYNLYSTLAANAFDNTNTFTQNTAGNYIEIGSGEVKANLTVKDIGQEVDYAFTYASHVRVTDNANLIVQPGVTIQFAKVGGGLTVESSACIKMQGAADNRIRLTGGASKGSWDCLSIYSYADNMLEYVDFVNGGNSTYYGAVWLEIESKVSMNHCLIDGSKAYGFYSRQYAAIPSFTGNTIKNCDIAPVFFYSLSSASGLDATSVLTGNANDYVHIDSYTVRAALTINAAGVPYYISQNISVEAPLTLNAGVTFWMGNGKKLSVTNPNGSLTVKGTAAQHVTFTRPAGTSYYWDGIKINILGSTFDYADLEYGGNTNNEGIIYVSAGLSCTLSNSSVKKSKDWGVVLSRSSSNPASISCTKVTFSDNADGNVRLSSEQAATGITDGTPFTGTLQ